MPDTYIDDIDLVEKMANLPILVVGDIMLDCFIYGRVERISPESPVPILVVERENTMLGGAGNALSNLSHLKCSPRIVSLIGADIHAEKIKDHLKILGVSTDGLVTVPARPTIVKTRFLAGHQQVLRTDFERTDALDPNVHAETLEKAKTLIEGAKALVISDYGKGFLTPAFLKSLIDLAKAKKIPVLVDPKSRDFSMYQGADVITPNRKELSEAVNGAAVETDEDIVKAARKLMKQCGIAAIVATRSKDGMSVINGAEAVHIRSAADIEVYDVSGAGDTVIATIAASLAAGANLIQAAAIANVAGSVVVAKVGTAPIRAQELSDALLHHDVQPHGAYIQDELQARETIQRWKARGLKVGFTNGCFDILHYGHVSYLNEARRQCDRLVVGLNRDSSVRILKGATRPVHDETSRAAVLAALGSVDMVVFFGAQKSSEDNTACKLIESLQPDLYFKGGDYNEDQIPEAPSVKACGGKIMLMPNFEGYSTTSSIAKMRDEKAA